MSGAGHCELALAFQEKASPSARRTRRGEAAFGYAREKRMAPLGRAVDAPERASTCTTRSVAGRALPASVQPASLSPEEKPVEARSVQPLLILDAAGAVR